MSESDASTMDDLHQACWTMLPWLVNGRISTADKQRFEQHLLACAECREELEQQRGVYEQLRRDQPLPLAPQASLQKLMTRIDDESDETPTAVPRSPSRRPAMLRKTPRWLALAAALQAVAIAALLTLVWQQREAEMSAPRFTTLSNAIVTRSDGILLRVVFSDQMTNAELRDWMRTVEAWIIAGPSEAGVYTVRLTRTVSRRDVESLLERVRAHPHVIFAEHVSAELER